MKNNFLFRRLMAGLLCALVMPSPLTAASIRTAATSGYTGISGVSGASILSGIHRPSLLTTPGMLLPLTGVFNLVPTPTLTLTAMSAAPSLVSHLVVPNVSVLAPMVSVAVPNIAVAAAEHAPAPLITVLQTVQNGLTTTNAQDKGGVATQKSLGTVFDGVGRNAAAVTPTPVSQPSSEPVSIIEKAQALFYPNGQTPAVAVANVPKPEGVPTDGEMNSKMELSPLTNPEREAAVIELFKAAGANPEEIIRQDAGRGRSNYYVVKKGTKKPGLLPQLRRVAYTAAFAALSFVTGQHLVSPAERIVIVGAHHDKVSEGRGTIDNWTGSTMMINLYQAMRDVDTEATFVFIAFAREEEGLLGSEAYLKSLSAADRKKVDAMVNLDTLGVDGTYSWKNNSSRSLLDLIAAVAKKGSYALTEALLNGGDADSSTFLHAGIPAMTVYGASEEVIFDIIHSERDNMTAFNLPHYKNAYLLTLALLKALDLAPVRK